MKLTVFTDYRYACSHEQVWTERAFVLFLNELAQHHELTVVGREGTPQQVAARYPLAPGITFRGLPFYESLAEPARALRTLPQAVAAFNRASAGADAVWLLGPNPHALGFVIAARTRRIPVTLGVRSDLPAIVASRYEGHRGFRAAASVLETAWRRLAAPRAHGRNGLRSTNSAAVRGDR